MGALLRFKRGKSTSWTEKNILLYAGEPGFETDTGKIKIGNGIDRWNDLPYVNSGEQEIYNAETHYEFPAIGNVNVIYKAETEKKLYQWNEDTYDYEVIGSTGETPSIDFDIIHGGNASSY